MKLSKAMLKGFEMVGGNQCKHDYCKGSPTAPQAVCAIGAASLAACGNAYAELHYCFLFREQIKTFRSMVGVGIATLNDKGMSIPDIAGIAASIEL